MTTWAELLNLALIDAGVASQGQVPSAEDTNNAKMRGNMMLRSWRRQRWLVYQLVDKSCQMTGAQSYTVGPGQDIDYPRQDSVEAAFMRQVYPSTGIPIDYPLRVIRSWEDYAKIAIKTLQAGPSAAVFFDSGYPIGRAYPWPIPTPSINYELHLLFKQVLDEIGSVQDEMLLPPEYEQTFYSNLVVTLCGAYKLPVSPVMAGLAKSSLAVIRSSNAQIPTMDLPASVTPGMGVPYNIFSDS